LNTLRRAILYDTRKTGKSLTLFLLFLLVTVFITLSFTVLGAVQTAAANLRETVGASFTLRGKPLELETDGNDYAMKFEPIFTQDIQQIADAPEIKAYNAQRTTSATADRFIYPSGMPSGPISANTKSAWNRNFTNGILTLTEGRHITGGDKSVALVSRKLAEENSLQVGDKLSFTDPATIVEVIGIYESDPSMEFDADTIFTDLGAGESGIERVDFFVTDPANLETAMAQIEGDYIIQANTAEYDAISIQLATIGRLTTVLIAAAIVVSTIVLLLILAMRIRGRIHEVGIFLAMGISKGNILAQFLIEAWAILLLAMLISCPISYLATVQIGAVLQSMIGTVSMTISVWELLAQYALETAVVTAGVIMAACPTMRLQPKEILSKLS
jgi:putative ABC transport system permease protein